MTGYEAETPAPAAFSVSSATRLHEGILLREDHTLEVDMFTLPQAKPVNTSEGRRIQSPEGVDEYTVVDENGAEYHFRKALKHLATAVAIAEEITSKERRGIEDIAQLLALADPETPIAEHWGTAEYMFNHGVRIPA